MPAKSKAQRRLFALALQYKKGELKKSEVSDEIIELSKLPEDKLKDYVKTKEDKLPDRVKEDVNLNPDMNVQGIGDVEFPENPSSANDFQNQQTGNSPINLKKKPHLLSYSDFLNLLKGKK